MTKKAMEQAIEAFQYIYSDTTSDEDEMINEAIAALRAALRAAASLPPKETK